MTAISPCQEKAKTGFIGEAWENLDSYPFFFFILCKFLHVVSAARKKKRVELQFGSFHLRHGALDYVCLTKTAAEASGKYSGKFYFLSGRRVFRKMAQGAK